MIRAMEVSYRLLKSIQSSSKIPNRHIMYKRYLDGEISQSEYTQYLDYVESLEKQAHDRFMNNSIFKTGET